MRLGILGSLRSVYSSGYIVLNLLIILAYYLVVEKLLSIQQFGVVFSTAPEYLILSLVLTSSMLLTIGVHTIFESRKVRGLGYEDAGVSCATAVIGGIMSGCGCQGAILYSGLTIILGSGEAYAVNTVFSEHIGLILAALTIFNIVLIVYSLGKVPGNRGGHR
ncbi:MAG: hypothetical protein KGH94_01355 [Candidatus Micrarchaeota archaeon]|nr:hypothetical protein [Candidatus Micrarchaeota archaeon]